MDVDLRLLRHAVALAEHRNFTRAAQSLGISQPALSRSIQALEQTAGTLLFDRQPQGVELTDAGRIYLQRARDLLSFADEFAQNVNLTRGLSQGLVTCGAGPFPAEISVAPAAARFASSYPGIQIELRIRNWDELLSALRARELDFFVAETSTLASESDLEIMPLGHHILYFMVRSGHPLAGRQVTFRDILAYPFATPARIPPRLLTPLLQGRPDAPQPLLEQAFPSIQCASLSVLRKILLSSDSVTALTLACMSDDLKQGRLSVLRTEPWLHLNYGIVCLKNRNLTASATAFRKFIEEQEPLTAIAESGLMKRYLPKM